MSEFYDFFADFLRLEGSKNFISLKGFYFYFEFLLIFVGDFYITAESYIKFTVYLFS